MSDPVAKLFSKHGANGSTTVPKAHLLDAVRMDVSNRNNGANNIFLENSYVQTQPSIMYYGGDTFIWTEDLLALLPSYSFHPILSKTPLNLPLWGTKIPAM